MTFSWETIAAALSAGVLPIGAWVGTIQQRVADSEKRHQEHTANMSKISGRLDEHIRVSNNTNVAVGQINGKLDILVAAHLKD